MRLAILAFMRASFQSCASELRTASEADAPKIFIGYLLSRSLLSFHLTPKDTQIHTHTHALNLYINFVCAAENAADVESIFVEQSLEVAPEQWREHIVFCLSSVGFWNHLSRSHISANRSELNGPRLRPHNYRNIDSDVALEWCRQSVMSDGK